MRIKEFSDALQKGLLDKANPVKNIDFNEGEFTANGKRYMLETKLSAGRYCEFVILQRELAAGMSLNQIYDQLIAQRKLLNDMRFVDAAVHVDKFINHCINLKQKEPTVLKLCTLFINEESEDRSTWGNDLVVKKLNDWKKENINVEDFFAIALTLAPGLINAYNTFTQNIIKELGIAEEIVSAAMEL